MSDRGLCHAEHCRRQVLPQPAISPLVRLIGNARVEQTKRQIRHGDSAAIEKVKRRNARKEERLGSASMAEQVAFMGRRKLLNAIMQRTP